MAKETFLTKVSSIGGDVVKSFLGIGSTSTNINPSSYGQGQAFGNNGWLFDSPAVGYDSFFSYNGLSDIVKAYEYCPPVYSIINKLGMEYINGKFYVMDKDGDNEATTEYARKIRKLFKNPNPLQNEKQFRLQLSVYTRLFGYCIVMPIVPVGYGLEDATSMWIIPPFMCDIEYSKQTFYNLQSGHILSIKVKYGNEESTLAPENVMIIRGDTPSFSNIALPSSPIKIVQQNVNNLIGIYQSKGTLINYRGALGILTPEVDPAGAIAMDDGEKDDIQKGLMQYGLLSGQRRYIIANTAMKWQQMGIAYRDLMLTEWTEDDTMVIADALNYPFKLLANTKSSSMNGTETDSYKKKSYQDNTIPFSILVDEQFAYYFKAEKNGCSFTTDYAHVPVLQDDDVKKSTARLILNQALKLEYETGLITKNKWLQLLGENDMGDDGEVRSTDVKESNVPLASIIGVGGVQSLISVLTSAGLSNESRSATLQILFGISPENAIAMSQNAEPETTTTEPETTTT